MNEINSQSFPKKPRTVTLGRVYPDYLSNSIETSKYSLVSFIPLNLVEQFSKLSNVYFLVLIFLQCIRAVSTSNGVPTILPSLVVIVSISAFKDFLEDYKRWKSDKRENNRKVQRLKLDAFGKTARRPLTPKNPKATRTSTRPTSPTSNCSSSRPSTPAQSRGTRTSRKRTPCT